ncbi:MAG: 2Fe-2S iron-sulfur cluster-binding protein [Cellvibrionaceae bacterium]
MMPLIFYVTHDGNMFEADVPVGNSVMHGAVENMIDGILGECGGVMSCATCHCYIDEQWMDKIGAASGTEKEMIEAGSEPRPNSRLSCQIKVSEELEGLTVHLPESQY